MTEPYRSLHVCKAGNLAGFAQSYFAFVDRNFILADHASLLCFCLVGWFFCLVWFGLDFWGFFLACSMLEYKFSQDG